MKQIELTQGLYTLVDQEDYIFLNQIKWSANYNKRTKVWYAVNSRKRLSLHRYLLGVIDSSILVKHKNGNTLDNRRENLELISKSESRIRSKKRTTTVNKSKFRGVWYDPRLSSSASPWRADLLKTYIGSFTTEKEAALAWNKVALETYGEAAQLNVIE